MSNQFDLGTLRADIVADTMGWSVPIRRGKKEMSEMASSVAKDLGRMDTAFDKSAKKAHGYKTGVGRNARGIAGNVGFQVQDIAVQLEQGTDAMRVFVQQGSQIAGAFGPTGAIVGAFIAVGGAIAGALLPSLFSAEDQLKNLEKASDILKGTFDKTKEGVTVLSDEMLELAKTNNIAAKSMVATAITAAVIEQAAAVDKLTESLEDLRAKYDYTMHQNVELAKGTGIIIKGDKERANNLKDIADKYGLTADEARMAGDAANRFAKLKTADAAAQLAATLDDLNIKYVQNVQGNVNATKAQRKQVESLSLLTSEVRLVVNELSRQEEIQKINNDLEKNYQDLVSKGDGKPEKTKRSHVDTILSQIEALERSVIKEEEGAEAAFRAQVGYEKLNGTLRARIDAAFDAKDAIQAQKEAEEELFAAVEESVKAYKAQQEFQERQKEVMTERLDELTKGLRTETQVMKDEYKKRYNEILYLTSDNLELRNDLIMKLDQEFGDKLNAQAQANAERMANTFQKSMEDFLYDPFDKGLKGMLDSFADMLRRMAAQAASQQIMGLLGGGKGDSNGWLNQAFGWVAGALTNGGGGEGVEGSDTFVGPPSGAAGSGKSITINQYFDKQDNTESMRKTSSQAAARAARTIKRGERNL